MNFRDRLVVWHVVWNVSGHRVYRMLQLLYVGHNFRNRLDKETNEKLNECFKQYIRDKDRTRGYTSVYTISNEALQSGETKCSAAQVGLYVAGAIVKIPLVIILGALYIVTLILEVIFGKIVELLEQLLNWIAGL